MLRPAPCLILALALISSNFAGDLGAGFQNHAFAATVPGVDSEQTEKGDPTTNSIFEGLISILMNWGTSGFDVNSLIVFLGSSVVPATPTPTATGTVSQTTTETATPTTPEPSETPTHTTVPATATSTPTSTSLESTPTSTPVSTSTSTPTVAAPTPTSTETVPAPTQTPTQTVPAPTATNTVPAPTSTPTQTVQAPTPTLTATMISGATVDLSDSFILDASSHWHYTGVNGASTDDDFRWTVEDTTQDVGGGNQATRIRTDTDEPTDLRNQQVDFWLKNATGELYYYGTFLPTAINVSVGSVPAQDIVLSDPVLVGKNGMVVGQPLMDTGAGSVLVNTPIGGYDFARSGHFDRHHHGHSADLCHPPGNFHRGPSCDHRYPGLGGRFPGYPDRWHFLPQRRGRSGGARSDHRPDRRGKSGHRRRNGGWSGGGGELRAIGTLYPLIASKQN